MAEKNRCVDFGGDPDHCPDPGFFCSPNAVIFLGKSSKIWQALYVSIVLLSEGENKIEQCDTHSYTQISHEHTAV